MRESVVIARDRKPPVAIQPGMEKSPPSFLYRQLDVTGAPLFIDRAAVLLNNYRQPKPFSLEINYV
jgi:hypothetical protein